MPLEKQIVDLKINIGIDELSDPYLSTRPVAMQNFRYARTGALSKRRGSTTIGLTNGNQLKRSNNIFQANGTPEAIYSYRGSLTILRNHALDLVQPVGAGTNLYKIDFVPRQIGNPTIVTRKLTYVDSAVSYSPDEATALRVIVDGKVYYGLAYIIRSSGTVTASLRFALYSEGLGSLFLDVVEAGAVPNGPSNVRLAWNGAAGIVIVWGNGTASRFATFNVQTLTMGAIAPIPTITAAFFTDSYDIQYDPSVNLTRIFYHNKATTQVLLDTVDPITLARNNSVIVSPVSATAILIVAMNIQEYIALTWADSQITAGTATGMLWQKSIVPTIQCLAQVFWNIPTNTFTSVGAHKNDDEFLSQSWTFCAIVNQPGGVGQRLHVWRAYSPNGIAEYPAQQIGSRGWISQPGPSSVPLIPEMGSYACVYFKAQRVHDGAPYYKLDGAFGLNIVELGSFGQSWSHPSQCVDGVFSFRGYDANFGLVRPRTALPPSFDPYTGLMSGGMTSVFDGANVVESAPFGAPFSGKLRVDPRATGSLTPLMTYGYAMLYSYVDGLGRKYRSAILFSAPTKLEAGELGFDLQVPAASMSNAPKPVDVELYRTVGNGSTFYFHTRFTAIPFGTIAFSDFTADSVIITHELLYTTDGSDQAVTGPGCDSLAYSNGRVWCVGTSDDRVYFSSDVTDGDEPRFTASFSFPVLSKTPIVAAAQLDTSTVLFSSNEIFRISGDGPALAPSGGGVFSPPQPIASEDGCFSPLSVITLDEGVAYQNKAGIKLLSRGGQVTDYGANIGPALGTDTITHLIGKALWPVYAPELEEVRWLAQTNSAITHVVTDRYLSRSMQQPVWYTYLYSQPTGASEVVAQCMHNGLPTWVTANGYVYKDDPTSFLDNAESLPSLWVTADVTLEQWRPQSVNGFMRIWKVALLAERKTPHDLTLRQFYNFSTSAGSTLTWTSSEIAALDRESLQVRCRFQRLNGFQVRITDATPSTGGTIGTGEGLSIKGVSLELGIDKGVVRRPAASQK